MDDEDGPSYPSMMLMFLPMGSCSYEDDEGSGSYVRSHLCSRSIADKWLGSPCLCRAQLTHHPDGDGVWLLGSVLLSSSLVVWSCASEARFSSHSLEVIGCNDSVSGGDSMQWQCFLAST